MEMARLALISLLLTGLLISGCAPIAAGTAGAAVADEAIVEDDGRFDPLENAPVIEEIYE